MVRVDLTHNMRVRETDRQTYRQRQRQRGRPTDNLILKKGLVAITL